MCVCSCVIQSVGYCLDPLCSHHRSFIVLDWQRQLTKIGAESLWGRSARDMQINTYAPTHTVEDHLTFARRVPVTWQCKQIYVATTRVTQYTHTHTHWHVLKLSVPKENCCHAASYVDKKHNAMQTHLKRYTPPPRNPHQSIYICATWLDLEFYSFEQCVPLHTHT